MRNNRREIDRRYKKNRYRKDDIYRLKVLLIKVVGRAIKHNVAYKENGRLNKILQINHKGLIDHLNNNSYGFECGMEGIDMDHIKPLLLAKTKKQIYEFFIYTNIQLLPSEYNRYVKGTKKWDQEHFEGWLMANQKTYKQILNSKKIKND